MVKRIVGEQFPKNYVLFDTETTGLTHTVKYHFEENDYIMEIAAIRVENNELVDEFNAILTLPDGVSIPDNIVELTGITNEFVEKEGRDRATVLKEFEAFIGDSILSGYNVNFDLSFLCREMNDLFGHYPSNEYFDIIDLARKYIKNTKNYKLGEMANELELVNFEQTHRALDDCYMSKLVYDHIRQLVLHDGVSPSQTAIRDVKSRKYI